MAEKKTFRTTCIHEDCKKPFHIRCELQDPDAEGESQVAVDCPYCGAKVMVPIPRVFQSEDHMVMHLKPVPPPTE